MFRLRACPLLGIDVGKIILKAPDRLTMADCRSSFPKEAETSPHWCWVVAAPRFRYILHTAADSYLLSGLEDGKTQVEGRQVV